MITESVPDACCPHCERAGTVKRIVRNEDGYTKVARVCVACNSEWWNSFDRDWLADAKNKKLQADNERLAHEIDRLTRERDEARAALKPFSMLYLWPDDADKWTRNEIRSDEDWDETRNDARTDDVFIRRGHIRAARKALEAKT